jgi:hypothetical protein
MCHHRTKGKGLIGGQSSAGNNRQGCIGFCIAKDCFLGSTSIMKHNHVFRRFGLIGYNDLVIKLKVARFKQMELYWPFALSFCPFARKNKPIAGAPGFGFPLGFKNGTVKKFVRFAAKN